MRGKILQYNGNDGTGIISSEGQQHRFTIAQWKGDTAPAVGKTVEVVLADGQVSAVMLVGDDVLLREKAEELGGKLGGLVGGLGSTLAKGGGGGISGGSIVQRYGTPVLVAYGVFLLSTIAFNAINVEMFGMRQGRPLWDLAGALSQMGGGGGVKLFLILAYLGIVVPLVWADKRAWLALLFPLVAMVWAIISAFRAKSGAGPMGDMIKFGILGFYLPLAAAVYLALAGFRKFKAAS